MMPLGKVWQIEDEGGLVSVGETKEVGESHTMWNLNCHTKDLDFAQNDWCSSGRFAAVR